MSKRAEPASRWISITNSDTVEIPADVRSLYVLTSGNLILEDITGNTETFPVTAGQVIPCQPVKILATGSTATALALY